MTEFSSCNSYSQSLCLHIKSLHIIIIIIHRFVYEQQIVDNYKKFSYRRDSARRRSLHRSNSFKVSDVGIPIKSPYNMPDTSADFLKTRLAKQIFRLIFGLAEFLPKLQNSAEIRLNNINSADTPDIQNKALQHIRPKFLTWYYSCQFLSIFTRKLLNA